MDIIRYKQNNKNRIRSIIAQSFLLISITITLLAIENYSKIILAVALILSSLCLFFIIKGLLNRDTIVINSIGIYSKVNGMGLIKWSFIDGFEIKKIINSTGIIVKINDQEGLLDEMNFVSKILMKSNIKKLGSPVILPESEFNESLEIVIVKLIAYKKSL
jgi:hypothetical protein